jgi:hypothetical protein
MSLEAAIDVGDPYKPPTVAEEQRLGRPMMPIALASNLPVAALVDACGARRLFGQDSRLMYRDIVASIKPGANRADERTYPFDHDDMWHFLGAVALLAAIGTALLFIWLLDVPGLLATVGPVTTGLTTCVLTVNSLLLGGFTPRLYQVLWQRSRLLLDATWATLVAAVVAINAIAFYG